ncbi:cytochrome c oxidase assembly protein PET191-domain-containing protein [Polychytrium aggregatum]|uniref:cytochrome c oxidase assembly protein PET191-domain-containing protein n=1 Tax=Polychytrium aggregatum TaxID=110093 RepID=UPI0022FF2249|nr:cytochrome c oxidase assembly protein PET191-domain-containing protein [Polychytrium aggregatum]KAI9190714.1 cytochrome c oxidase assembly protein PET191-domain-containing protein [Polychytrium aggregatum]
MPSCKAFFDDLVSCLLESDCVLVQRHSVKECLLKEYDDSVPRKCRLAQQIYLDCKHSTVDPRKRMRGPYGANVASSKPAPVGNDQLGAEAASQ